MKKGDKYTHRFEVNEEVYMGFLKLFKDKSSIHTDEEFAKMKGFKLYLMHGSILNGFISYFIGEVIPEKDIMEYSLTTDFKSPVYLNDSVTLHAYVADMYESVNSGKIKFYFENDEGIKVAKGSVLIGINL